jgi:hypothetical protein
VLQQQPYLCLVPILSRSGSAVRPSSSQAGKSINAQQYCVGLVAKPPISATQSDPHSLSNQRNLKLEKLAILAILRSSIKARIGEVEVGFGVLNTAI